ncbi:hypothetical protein AN958_00008 [Leucoagaricus sp. SymC.cos]|nr:hypothetical protein AN958_00008 [Leucoagaricus sp. SymC.cos]
MSINGWRIYMTSTGALRAARIISPPELKVSSILSIATKQNVESNRHTGSSKAP